MKAYYLILLLFSASFIGVFDCYGQGENNITVSITITGVIVDEFDEPMMNASVTSRNNDELLSNTNTDSIGEFSFHIATTGITNLNILIEYAGYKNYIITNIKPLTDTIARIKVKMHPSDNFLKDVELPICIPLRLDEFDGGHTKTITSEEIEKGAY